MKTKGQIEIRRCRPLLGTFVEIQAAAVNAADLHYGFEAAFAAIEQVQRLMSFHDRQSELSCMNRDAFYRPVRVHPWTWRVLKSARELSRNTHGIFDITTAQQLVKWNYLPRYNPRIGHGIWRDIIFEKNCHVRFRRPLTIDLGGIAKGFAVDRAVAALKRNGVAAGLVNAGGDLRAFGSRPQLVHLRHPAHPTRVAGAVRLRARALATSAVYFAARKNRSPCTSPLLDGRTRQSSRKLISVTVAAANCMTADALTKVVFVLHERAAPLLARYGADALLLERNGAPSWIFHPLCDTPHQTWFD